LKILSKLGTRLLAWALLPMLLACTTTTPPGSGEVLVRVYDKYLYASDLEGIVPPGSSVRDSLTMVRTFIQNWVDKELIVKKAEENLHEDLKDFTLQLEDYRHSLIIFEYEKMLVRQELDTNISNEDVQQYYMKNRGNFALKEDIMSMQYLILHIDSPAIQKFRQYMRSEIPEEQDSLALYSSKYALAYNPMREEWINLREMTEIVPKEEYSYAEYMSDRRYFELRDSAFIYLIRFRDYKPVDSISPVQFVVPEIKKNILNKRKNELIRSMRQTVLQDAIEHNQVEIY